MCLDVIYAGCAGLVAEHSLSQNSYGCATCLYLCVSVFLCVCVYVCVYVCLSVLSVCLYVLYVCLYVLSVCLYVLYVLYVCRIPYAYIAFIVISLVQVLCTLHMFPQIPLSWLTMDDPLVSASFAHVALGRGMLDFTFYICSHPP